MSSIMLPGWDDVPLAERLSAPLGGLPVFVDNDATAAGYGEYLSLGSPEGLNMVLLTVGTGIGGAIIIDGELYRGATGTSAEFGNTTIDWQGETCWCGNKGCLNMLASGTAMANRTVEEGARALGAGVANIINIFNPDRVVLTGGVTSLGEAFLDQVRQEASWRAFSESMAHARIEYSVRGIEVGALGAAGLIRDHVEGR
jgi:glucokinase